MDSSEDDEHTENYHNFFNFSILNEGKLVVKFLLFKFRQKEVETYTEIWSL